MKVYIRVEAESDSQEIPKMWGVEILQDTHWQGSKAKGFYRNVVVEISFLRRWAILFNNEVWNQTHSYHEVIFHFFNLNWPGQSEISFTRSAQIGGN
jgi:hypothetical protein